MMGRLLKIFKFFVNFVLIVVVFIAGLFAAGHFKLIDFYKPFIVTSGSMEPAIPTGSVVLVKPKIFGYTVGDVITYKFGKTTTTHRIHKLVMQESRLSYQTKGDANQDPDMTIIHTDQVVGSVRYYLPYLGYAGNFAKSPQGFILLVIVPATIVIYEELKNVTKELVRLLAKLFRRKFFQDNSTVDSTNQKRKGDNTPNLIALEQINPNQEFFLDTNSTPHQTHLVSEERRQISTLIFPKIEQIKSKIMGFQINGLFHKFSQTSDCRPITRDWGSFLNFRYALLPVVAGLCITLAATNAFFTDNDSSSNNVLGAADNYGEQVGDLYLDNTGAGFTCPTGVTDLSTPRGLFIFKQTGSQFDIDIKLENALPNTTYDLWVNQDPGACPLNSATQTAFITTDGSGNATATYFGSILDGANTIWISLVGGGQVVRSTIGTIN